MNNTMADYLRGSDFAHIDPETVAAYERGVGAILA